MCVHTVRIGLAIGFKGLVADGRVAVAVATVRIAAYRPQSTWREAVGGTRVFRQRDRSGRCGLLDFFVFWRGMGGDADGAGPCTPLAPEGDLDADCA